ncbi:hypothetical protein SAMN05660461_4457 [Chitinophaga ginsengisegetis]|uniref:Outer membrane protein beta-barrel domain-containing protein n=1 Tax=Chitinophaga ginsengisegetis TaxID=393003 RepID=A0A1T5P790_9BACT|nr:hypothetical protein [Chitinophaga ginsengisegetis]MDR6565981.1 hypothetical protein [Chitinophaga ginsengisegetis]MDR6645710.1 hypothetical protein [Chitinophaga ginsengisegetis]MDR6651698.1 hypothetical protein [Chitinophaga ginsengisegetis]SKD08585.1 hypothetical protein SAMN05660461_4457 [Chitinophaga ginsengisegetis]
MKKTLLLIWLSCSFILSSSAQDGKTQLSKNTFLKVNPTTLINELDIYLEQEITDKFSLEVGISGIYTDYPDYVLAKKIDIGQKKPDISTEQFVDGRGLGFRVGARLYLISQEMSPSRAAGTYFEPVLFVKKVFYPNEDNTFSNITYTNSGDKTVIGLQLLVGRQFKKDRFILDPFIGVGIRSKIYKYNTYHFDDDKVSLNDGKMVSILPSLQIGIKMGLKLW